jgi:Domain of unknown function (DUF6046)
MAIVNDPNNIFNSPLPYGPLLSGGITALTVRAETKDKELLTTYLGTPVYSNLVFKGDATASSGSPAASDLTINTVLFQVMMRKNIIETALQGRDGTIKEYISMGDYEINIMGEIVSELPLVFPKTNVKALRAFCELPKQIAVVSDFLSLFGINNIVVNEYTCSEKMGSRNEVPFTMYAVSDVDLNLDLS